MNADVWIQGSQIQFTLCHEALIDDWSDHQPKFGPISLDLVFLNRTRCEQHT